jgi:hypothetical protein
MSHHKESDDNIVYILIIAFALPMVLILGMMWPFGSTDKDTDTDTRIEAMNLIYDNAAYNEVENMRFIKHENTGLCFGYINGVGHGRAITKIDCALIEDQLLIYSIE